MCVALWFFDLAHFFQIQEPLGLVQKSSLVPCTHYTLP
jgi:hypothetical protein